MAVNLTDAELSAGMMLTGATGSSLDTPPEPILGRIQRFLAVATAIINMRIPEAPDGRTKRVRRQVEHLLVQPAAGGQDERDLANAWVNSGCGMVAADWTQPPVSGGALTLHLRGLSPWPGGSSPWNGWVGC